MAVRSNNIAIAFSVGILLAVFCFLFYYAKMMGGDQRKAKLYSVQFSMQMVYDKALEKNTGSSLNSNDISTVIRNEGLPSFVNAKGIFLSSKSVPLPSHELLLAVQTDTNTIYGIDASRQFRIIGSNEFREWPYVRFSWNVQ